MLSHPLFQTFNFGIEGLLHCIDAVPQLRPKGSYVVDIWFITHNKEDLTFRRGLTLKESPMKTKKTESRSKNVHGTTDLAEDARQSDENQEARRTYYKQRVLQETKAKSDPT